LQKRGIAHLKTQTTIFTGMTQAACSWLCSMAQLSITEILPVVVGPCFSLQLQRTNWAPAASLFVQLS